MENCIFMMLVQSYSSMGSEALGEARSEGIVWHRVMLT